LFELISIYFEILFIAGRLVFLADKIKTLDPWLTNVYIVKISKPRRYPMFAVQIPGGKCLQKKTVDGNIIEWV